MVFNATFKNISVISWWSIFLVEETRVPGENYWPVASHWQTLSHNVVDFWKFIGPSGKKITRTVNTDKYTGPGVRQIFLFVYFVLHRKSEMQLVCRNDHGQLGIRFCFKWHLLPKHATVSMVILLIIVFL